ncbi:ATP-binding protein [Streptomyces sp. NPDC057682]|uniref:ATP-binding protein n=1 Tax=Streptomyces sp. NPDC057682 TaxID=3346210 RepID=UPI00369BBF41
MNAESTGYDSTRIEMLEGWAAVRKRPGMYVGSTGERGLAQMVFDVADRAVNEVLGGRATSVAITLTADGGLRVADDGPGIPVDGSDGAAGSGLEALLTETWSEAGVEDRHEVAFSAFGLGLGVINALSHRMTAEVRRGGIRWVQEYARGVAVTPVTEVGTADGSGTTITFWPDADIFGRAQFSFDSLEKPFRELAPVYPLLDVSLADLRRPDEPRSVRIRFPGGLGKFVDVLDAHTAATPMDTLAFAQEDSRMSGVLEVAFRWCGCPGERVRSYANGRPTLGGTHVTGFRRGAAAALTAYARERGILTPSDPDIDPEGIGTGLTAVVSVKLDRPEFEGSTRGVLGNAEVTKCLEDAVRDRLGKRLREDPEGAAAVGPIVRGARRG